MASALSSLVSHTNLRSILIFALFACFAFLSVEIGYNFRYTATDAHVAAHSAASLLLPLVPAAGSRSRGRGRARRRCWGKLRAEIEKQQLRTAKRQLFRDEVRTLMDEIARLKANHSGPIKAEDLKTFADVSNNTRGGGGGGGELSGSGRLVERQGWEGRPGQTVLLQTTGDAATTGAVTGSGGAGPAVVVAMSESEMLAALQTQCEQQQILNERLQQERERLAAAVAHYSRNTTDCNDTEPSIPFPQSVFDPRALLDANVRWDLHRCKSYGCINSRLLGDCRDCFNLTLEAKRWKNNYRGAVTLAEVMKLKPPGSIRIGLDARAKASNGEMEQRRLRRGRPRIWWSRESAEQAVNQGLELYKKGRVRDALRRFEMALEMKPSEEEAQAALYNKACCHAFREEGAQAQEALRDALRYGLQFSVILSDRTWRRSAPCLNLELFKRRKGGEEVGGKFRRDLKLIAEVQAPFRGVRRFLYVALGMAAGIATVITIPRFILAVQGGVDAPDLLTTGGNLAIDLGGGAAMVGLYLWEQRREEEQMGRVSRDETLSRLPLRLQSGKVVELVQLRGTTRPAAVGQGGGAGAAELREPHGCPSVGLELQSQLGDWSCSPSVGTGAAVPAWGWSCSPSVGTGAAVPAWGLELQSSVGLELQSQLGDWSCSPSVGTGAAVPAWGLELQSQWGLELQSSVGTGAAVPAWGLELQSQGGDWSCSPAWGLELQFCPVLLCCVRAGDLSGRKEAVQQAMKRAEGYRKQLQERGCCWCRAAEQGRRGAGREQEEGLCCREEACCHSGVAGEMQLQQQQQQLLYWLLKVFPSRFFVPCHSPWSTRPPVCLLLATQRQEEFEEKAREAAAKRVAEADDDSRLKWCRRGSGTSEWVRSQQKAEKVAEGTDAFIVLRLDGRVRKSGTGMPDWADLINELPPLDSLVSKLER
ncbi:unnamed protein product [Closterium sp. NIES-64]|nr:unnamed protein product [Closterium sp. NIES-64]